MQFLFSQRAMARKEIRRLQSQMFNIQRDRNLSQQKKVEAIRELMREVSGEFEELGKNLRLFRKTR